MLVRLDRMSRIEEARSRAAQAPLFSSPLLSASIRPLDPAQPSGNKDSAGAAEQAAEGRAQMGSRREVVGGEVVGGEEPEAMDQEKLNALAKTASEKVSEVSSSPVCCGVRPWSTRSFATSIASSSTVGSSQRRLIEAILCSRSFCSWVFARVQARNVT